MRELQTHFDAFVHALKPLNHVIVTNWSLLPGMSREEQVQWMHSLNRWSLFTNPCLLRWSRGLQEITLP